MRPFDPDQVGARVREEASRVHAPAGLRAHVAEARLRSRPAPRRRVRLAVAGGAVAVLAAALLALVVVLPGGSDEPPSITATAATALKAPTSPAPVGRDARSLTVGGVAFPAGGRNVWRPVGVRTDRVGGRTATTVTYAGSGRLVSYTILDGPPLAVPADAAPTQYEGIAAAILRHDGATIVTWRRGGRTCILTSRNADAGAMLDLAALS